MVASKAEHWAFQTVALKECRKAGEMGSQLAERLVVMKTEHWDQQKVAPRVEQLGCLRAG